MLMYWQKSEMPTGKPHNVDAGSGRGKLTSPVAGTVPAPKQNNGGLIHSPVPGGQPPIGRAGQAGDKLMHKSDVYPGVAPDWSIENPALPANGYPPDQVMLGPVVGHGVP